MHILLLHSYTFLWKAKDMADEIEFGVAEKILKTVHKQKVVEVHAGAWDSVLLAVFQEIIKFTIWGFEFFYVGFLFETRLRLATHIYSQDTRHESWEIKGKA